MVSRGYSLVLDRCKKKNSNDILFFFPSNQEVGAEVLVKISLLKKFGNNYFTENI